MKKIIIPTICIIILSLTYFYIDDLTDKIFDIITEKHELVIKEPNKYAKNYDYMYVSRTNDFNPYSFQDLLNIYYTVINNGWKQFTFYCPKEYKECINDVSKISGDDLILTHLNNYVHPFNSFTNIKTSFNESGEITLKINYLYTETEIKEIDYKTDEILNKLITNKMNDSDKIKTIHDYIINNTKYDTIRNEKKDSEYKSYNAYGPLFQGYAICNGYTDLMAIYLTKLGFNNYKIATTPNEISYSDSGHIWNAVYFDNKWVHLDLTWDDPVSSDNKDYLFHTYFLIDTKKMNEADSGKTVIEEHNFNKLYYLEFNN